MTTPSIHIEQASGADASVVASVLQEAAQWLADDGRPLWAPSSISLERVSQDIEKKVFFVTRAGDDVAGVMKFELEDAFFWPEIPNGTSAFVHKLAVRRAWAKQGISNQLLAFARTRAKNLGLQHLRLDCMADRAGLRQLYEGFGFMLHSYTDKGGASFARYALALDDVRLTAHTGPIRQGDLFWIRPDEARGSVPGFPHPHLVIQDDVLNRSRLDTVVVCALTSDLNRGREPGNVLLEPGEGNLSKQSAIVVSQVSSLKKEHLGQFIGALSSKRVEEVLAGMRFQQASFFNR